MGLAPCAQCAGLWPLRPRQASRPQRSSAHPGAHPAAGGRAGWQCWCVAGHAPLAPQDASLEIPPRPAAHFGRTVGRGRLVAGELGVRS